MINASDAEKIIPKIAAAKFLHEEWLGNTTLPQTTTFDTRELNGWNVIGWANSDDVAPSVSERNVMLFESENGTRIWHHAAIKRCYS